MGLTVGWAIDTSQLSKRIESGIIHVDIARFETRPTTNIYDTAISLFDNYSLIILLSVFPDGQTSTTTRATTRATTPTTRTTHHTTKMTGIVLPTKSDSEVMFCLQSYQGLIIDRSLVY